MKAFFKIVLIGAAALAIAGIISVLSQLGSAIGAAMGRLLY